MIRIIKSPISPEFVVDRVKTNGSGCVVTYIGLIRGYSKGKGVLSVEYEDVSRMAESELRKIGNETRQIWQLDNIAIYHRIGKLKVGDVNLVVAVASAHRQEGFAACQYVIDRFKKKEK